MTNINDVIKVFCNNLKERGINSLSTPDLVMIESLVESFVKSILKTWVPLSCVDIFNEGFHHRRDYKLNSDILNIWWKTKKSLAA